MKTESNFCMYIIIKSMRGSVTPLIKKNDFSCITILFLSLR